jgi:hypothetical protein
MANAIEIPALHLTVRQALCIFLGHLAKKMVDIACGDVHQKHPTGGEGLCITAFRGRRRLNTTMPNFSRRIFLQKKRWCACIYIYPLDEYQFSINACAKFLDQGQFSATSTIPFQITIVFTSLKHEERRRHC